jgi:hypothetical protein
MAAVGEVSEAARVLPQRTQRRPATSCCWNVDESVGRRLSNAVVTEDAAFGSELEARVADNRQAPCCW